MLTRSSKLIKKVEKDGGSDKDIIRYVAEDVLEKARSQTMSKEDWEAFAKGLFEAKPQMASVFNLCNGVLLSLDDKDPDASIIRLAEGILKRPDPMSSIARMVSERYSFQNIMTNSYSATVLSVLKELSKKGKLRVIVAESMPMGEGAMFAEALVAAGVNTVIIPDSMVFECMDDVDAYICGTDLISPQGVFNKIGSRAIATAASMADKKVIVVCDSLKICPRSIKKFERMIEPAGKGIHRSIKMFETFSLDLLDQVITEGSAFSKDDLDTLFNEWEIDPHL